MLPRRSRRRTKRICRFSFLKEVLFLFFFIPGIQQPINLSKRELLEALNNLRVQKN